MYMYMNWDHIKNWNENSLSKVGMIFIAASVILLFVSHVFCQDAGPVIETVYGPVLGSYETSTSGKKEGKIQSRYINQFLSLA